MHFKYINELQKIYTVNWMDFGHFRDFVFLEIFLLLLGLVLLINYCVMQFFSDLLAVSEQENSLQGNKITNSGQILLSGRYVLMQYKHIFDNRMCPFSLIEL